MRISTVVKTGFIIFGAFILITLILVRTAWFWDALNPIFHKDLLYKYAGEYKLDPLFIAAIIHVESKFNPVATSHAGALGLMQIKPDTANEIAKELNLDYVNVEELYEPEKNINMGFYYISKLCSEFNGNLILSLAAYNAGITKAKEWAKIFGGKSESDIMNAIDYPETKQFVKKVLKTYSRFKFIQKIRRVFKG